MIQIFTSSSANYYPKVKLLRDSVKKYCKEVKFNWLIVEKRDELIVDKYSSEFDRILFATDMDMCRSNSWLFSHSIVELSTAVKPAAAMALLGEQGTDAVVYFDPDMVIFSEMDDLFLSFQSQGDILLTPHICQAESSMDAILDNEVGSLKHGVFNLGFFGVKKSDEGLKFLNWWNDRLQSFCLAEVESGLFTDQKWINFAPIFFENVKILKSPRYNVATWNLSHRNLTGSFQDGFKVDGMDLGFYHFTGFDSGAHERMAMKYQPGNRSVKELISWYKENGDLNSTRALEWNLSRYSNGEKIKESHRKIYRSRKDLQSAFPNPYDCSSERSFYGWIMNQGAVEYPKDFK